MENNISSQIKVSDIISTQWEQLSQFNFSLISCALWEVDQSWSIPPRKLPDTYLFLSLSGDVLMIINQKKFQLKPDEALFIPEATIHSAKLKKKSKEAQLIAIHFHADHIFHGSLFPFKSEVNFKYTGAFQWIKMFTHLAKEIIKNKSVATHLGSSLIKQFLIDLTFQNLNLNLSARNLDQRITQSLKMIRDLPMHQITVKIMAKSCQLSEVQFRKIFQKQIGQRPSEYIISYKLKIAKALLRNQDLNIKQIAHETGFCDEHYFRKSFSKFFDCSPSNYRKYSLKNQI